MAKKTETQKYREKILKKVSSIDIPGYMYEEVEKMLEYLHYYKLRNIFKNSELLISYLDFLNKENYKQIEKLLEETSEKSNIVLNLSYFVSADSIEKLWEDELNNMLNNISLQPKLQILMQWIQWLLVLTANEFCHATSTRISLNKMKLERKTHKTIKNGSESLVYNE